MSRFEHPRARRGFLAIAILVLGLHGTAVIAQDDAPPAPCSGDAYRQFDFWVGSWEVRDPDGAVVGTNRITPILDGCVLLEEWTSADGSNRGKSFNVFDRTRAVWHQTWVDVSGLLLQLEGGLVDGAMVLEGRGSDRNGDTILHRIRWTPHPDGSVRQVWTSSHDDGGTWTVAFDGTYRRTTATDRP